MVEEHKYTHIIRLWEHKFISFKVTVGPQKGGESFLKKLD